MASAPVCAKHLFISPTRFRDLIAAGTIARQPTGQYDLNVVRREYITNLQKVASGRGADDAGLSKARVRLEAAKTEKVEFGNAVARGDYVRLSVFAKRLESLFVVMREIALTIPGSISDRIAVQCDADRVVVFEIVRDAIYQMLEQMSVAEIVAPSKNGKTGRRRADADDEARML